MTKRIAKYSSCTASVLGICSASMLILSLFYFVYYRTWGGYVHPGRTEFGTIALPSPAPRFTEVTIALAVLLAVTALALNMASVALYRYLLWQTSNLKPRDNGPA